MSFYHVAVAIETQKGLRKEGFWMEDTGHMQREGLRISCMKSPIGP